MDRSRIYPEVIGDYSRGWKVDPPEFPDACPACGAERNDDPETPVPHPYDRGETVRIGNGGRWATYACGGYYKRKPQIQNHTDYWWGKCGDN